MIANWFSTMPGSLLLSQEKIILDRLLKASRGDIFLQIGSLHNKDLKNFGWFKTKCIVRPCHLSFIDEPCIQANLHQLPIEPNSIDVVLVMHQLEIADQPEAVLAEIFRVLKPNGRVIITCFNKLSLWQAIKFFQPKNFFPWNSTFYSIGKVKRWLTRQDFKVTHTSSTEFRLPMKSERLADKLFFLEVLGQFCCSNAGAAFIMSAYKKVEGVTPLPILKFEKKLPLRGQYIESPASRVYYHD